MRRVLTTREVARKLGVSYHTVWNLVKRFKQMKAPGKNGSGAYLWWPADVRRAQGLLARRGGAKGTARRLSKRRQAVATDGT